MKINKSLYYVFNNQYYNAFNDKDINNLLSNMDNGYHVNINKNLNGNNRTNPIRRNGNGKIIYDLLKNDLRSTLMVIILIKLLK